MNKVEDNVDKISRHNNKITTTTERFKNKKGLRKLQDNKKHNNIHIKGMPEGEED